MDDRVQRRCAGLVLIGLIGVSASAQDVGVQPIPATESTASEISQLIEEIESSTGENITSYLGKRFATGASLSDNPGSLPSIICTLPANAGDITTGKMYVDTATPNSWQDADFGYAVKAGTGEIIEAFGPLTPVIAAEGDPNKLTIPGYNAPPNSEIIRVGRQEYGEINQEILDKIRSTSRQSATGITTFELADKINVATTALLVQICPQSYYPTEMELFMDAGFNFVIVATNTGTKLTFNMPNSCADFLTFLQDEQEKVTNLIEP